MQKTTIILNQLYFFYLSSFEDERRFTKSHENSYEARTCSREQDSDYDVIFDILFSLSISLAIFRNDVCIN